MAGDHGDATLDNVVQGNKELRWIDPISPSIIIPAFKAVDLGKLLQSSHGWEFFLNGKSAPPEQDNAVLEGESIEDQNAARYFHALCYLRILRYAAMARDIAIHNYAMNHLYDCLS